MVCNKLHINLEKPCYMHFKKYMPISYRVDSLSNSMTYNIHINTSELKKVTHTKFLGVIIDKNSGVTTAPATPAMQGAAP